MRTLQKRGRAERRNLMNQARMKQLQPRPRQDLDPNGVVILDLLDKVLEEKEA